MSQEYCVHKEGTGEHKIREENSDTFQTKFIYFSHLPQINTVMQAYNMINKFSQSYKQIKPYC